MTDIAKKTWSDEELLAMPKDGYKREIVGGELTMSPAGFDHGSIIARLFAEMGKTVYSGNLGELADGQTGFRLASGDLFCPDIAFVTTARVAEHRLKGPAFFIGAPDLAVEVLSPSDTVEVLQEKLEQFFAEGTRLAWVINPRKRCVYVHRSPVQSCVLQAHDILTGEEVLPGFQMVLSRLFVQGA